MIFQDDRTPEQKKIPHVIILGTDRFLSGWGEAKGGPSYAGWACPADNYNDTLCWVEQRSDMMRVRIVGSNYRPPSGPGHCHIYTRFPE
jgi:hypothetical protein